MKRTSIFLIILLISAAAAGWLLRTDSKADSEIITTTHSSSVPAHPYIFYDEQAFLKGVGKTRQTIPDFSYHIAGGIVPHHLLPGYMLTDFFHRLSKQNPKTIILIGPNHYEKGKYRVLTSKYAWDTPFGTVQPNDSIIRKIVSEKYAYVDESVVPYDHSVAGMMPFIRYYLPNTHVVPLIISGFTTQKEVEVLAAHIAGYMDENTVLVAPVDFSHYLVNKQAQEKDKQTLSVMKNYDYRQLFALNNDYLDSPASIATLLMVMEKLGKTQMDIIHHTNSGEMIGDDTIETTSYFTIAFY